MVHGKEAEAEDAARAGSGETGTENAVQIIAGRFAFWREGAENVAEDGEGKSRVGFQGTLSQADARQQVGGWIGLVAGVSTNK